MEAILPEPTSIITMENKINFIKEFVSKHQSQYVDIEESESINSIYNLIKTGELAVVQNPIECLYYGWYCHHILEDYIKMKMYYMVGIEKEEMYCAVNLSHYYKEIKKNDKKYVEYTLMAIDEIPSVITSLALHYKDNKQYDEMEKYFKKAIDNGIISAAVLYASYFYEKKDTENMLKYLTMALDMPCKKEIDNQSKKEAIQHIIQHYRNLKDYDTMKVYLDRAIHEFKLVSALYYYGDYHQTITKDFKSMKEYYMRAINMDNINSMVKLAEHYKNIEKNYDEAEQLLLCALKHSANNKNDTEYICVELAHLYQYYKKDINNAIKHYEMTINCDSPYIVAMYKLAQLYQSELKDYEKMKVYYDMVMNAKYEDNMDLLGYFYLAGSALITHYDHVEKNEEKSKEYKKKLGEKISLFDLGSLGTSSNTLIKEISEILKSSKNTTVDVNYHYYPPTSSSYDYMDIYDLLGYGSYKKYSSDPIDNILRKCDNLSIYGKMMGYSPYDFMYGFRK